MSAFLGVESSLTGRCWVGPDPAQDRMAEALAQHGNLPLSLAQILARRGVAQEDVASFLSPSLRELMPDPSVLRDLDKAAERFLEAVRRHERIAIFADYDVDGGASAALLLRWLRQVGASATLYIPDRIDEGYGPNVPAMEALARDHDLIVAVDCGTLSHAPIAAAAPADVIVLDHHLGGETLPPAIAVVNPNRQDETGELSYLCAAGVVFLLLVAVNRLMRQKGPEGPDLMGLLDLVALATVADVAPLVGLNRALVRQGLKVMAMRRHAGLVALGDVARLDAPPNTYHLGFLLGPRVNAGGRIGAADLGARLLATDDVAEAEALALRLDRLNTERREIEDAVRVAALAQAEARGVDGPLVWAAGDGWHPGVVGIVASRLKEAFNRPAVVIGFEGDAGKGSGRSVAGVDLGVAVQRLVAEGLLEKGGGHRMAAGLSLGRAQLDAAMSRLGELLAARGAGTAGPVDLRLDGLIQPRAATIDLVEMLEQAGPYGAGAPSPRFAFADMRVGFSRRVGENHLQVSFKAEGGARLDAIAFRAFDSEIGPVLDDHKGAVFHVAGRLEIDSWGGRRNVKLRIEDVARSA